MNRAELLESALVTARPKAYGPPERNFDRIARFWSVYAHDAMGAPPDMRTFTATDVACMMALMKIARLEETPDHLDSWTDLAGYAACGVEVATGTVIEHSADEATWIEVPYKEDFPSDLKAGDRVRLGGFSKQKFDLIPDGEYGATEAWNDLAVTSARRSRPRWYKPEAG